MSIAKPFVFQANTYAKSSEVNADFDILYSQVNTNISNIAKNATDIDNLELNKANVNGNSAQRFAVADPQSSADAINKQTLFKQIGNVLPFISGYIITKDSGSPEDTIIVSAGSCYDSTHTVILAKTLSTTKQNSSQNANATYYVYVIGNATGSSIDILISASSDNPGLPAGYTLYRQIGYYTTDGDGYIKTISYYGSDSNSDKSINAIMDAIAPDYSAGVTITDGYVAQSAGVICFYGSYGYVKIDNVSVGGCSVSAASGYFNGTFHEALIGVGQTVTVVNSVNDLTFYPLKGVSNA